jgi:hypothetical protein
MVERFQFRIFPEKFRGIEHIKMEVDGASFDEKLSCFTSNLLAGEQDFTPMSPFSWHYAGFRWRMHVDMKSVCV